MSNDTKDWAKELIRCIHFLHAKGWAPATSSNYSFRINTNDPIHISASGLDKGDFSTDDLMLVDAQGKALDKNRRPSAETLLHTLIYEQAPATKCILHTHSVYNTVLSTLYAENGALTLSGFEVLKGIAGIKTHEVDVKIPIFPNSQEMTDLSAEIKKYWNQVDQFHGFLLAGHGFYTWGKTIAEAKRHMEVFEFLFECFYKIEMAKH
ncbi:MAG: methylthioribulose 1-phosphate dehydratase [Bacteroidota bacterium]